MKRLQKNRIDELTAEFVDEIPIDLEPGLLYLSCRYRAAIHLCACGCGAKISTPLHPTGWRIQYDGESVTLSPSVGNWSEKCQSHYIIRNNKVLWSYQYSKETIQRIRDERRRDINRYYGRKDSSTVIHMRIPIVAYGTKYGDSSNQKENQIKLCLESSTHRPLCLALTQSNFVENRRR